MNLLGGMWNLSSPRLSKSSTQSLSGVAYEEPVCVGCSRLPVSSAGVACHQSYITCTGALRIVAQTRCCLRPSVLQNYCLLKWTGSSGLEMKQSCCKVSLEELEALFDKPVALAAGATGDQSVVLPSPKRYSP